MLALSITFTFVAEKLTFGRSVYAIGGNREAAKYAGINVNRITIIVFMLSGLMSAVAGIIMQLSLNAALHRPASTWRQMPSLLPLLAVSV